MPEQPQSQQSGQPQAQQQTSGQPQAQAQQVTEQHLLTAGAPAAAVQAASRFGVSAQGVLTLALKYGPVLFQLLQDLASHAGSGSHEQPNQGAQ